MEAPTLLIESKTLSVDTFNLLFENKECTLNISRTSTSLKFVLKQTEYNNIYEGNFTLEELNKISNIFMLLNSLEEIQKSLKQTISSKKVKLIKVNINQINLILEANVFEKTIDIIIPLIQREINQKEIIEKLLNDNKDLKKEIICLKEENKNIKEENKNIKSTLDLIQKKLNEYDILLNNNNNLKNSKISITNLQNNLLINRLKLVEQFKDKIYFEFNLLYRGTRDGDDSKTFHQLCDNKRNILVLVQTTKNKKFGGFCSIGYQSQGGAQKDNSAFIFSLDKLKIYNIIKDDTAVFWDSNSGPLFSGSTNVVDNKFFTKDCYSTPKNNYYQIPENYDYNGGEFKFRIKEIEVYQIN